MSKISVVVPVYDVEKYLSVCIDSILEQTFSDFDLVLVNDGSPDNCGAICEAYKKKDDRISVIHKTNGGLSDARNCGIDWCLKNSNSDWITFVDSDDYLHSQYLERLYDAAISNNLSVCCCRYKAVYNHNRNAESVKNDLSIFSPETFFVNSFNDSVSPIHNCAWAKLYKKSFFSNIRYPFGRYYEDAYTTHLIIFEQEKIGVLSDMLYYYYINPDGITLSKTTKKHIIDRFDSKICRLEYFSSKGLWKPFELIFDEACFDIHKWLYTYKGNEQLKTTVLNNKKQLFDTLKLIDSLPGNFNYKKRYKAQLKKAKKYFKDLVRNDYINIKENRSFPIAVLFKAKRFLEIVFFRD